MATCKFGLNDHKPFLGTAEENHHHHDEKNKNNLAHISSKNIGQKFTFSTKKDEHLHEHSHSHSHGACGHDHTLGGHTHDHRGTDKKVLKIALVITLITMFAEFFYGFLSNSLALISDAIHMFTHSFALIISLVAIIIASKVAPISKTFGYYRIEVLAAFINGITIIWIVYEAYERFINPQIIDIKMAMIVASIGLVVNIITGVILMQGDRNNINLKSAFVHMLSDALSSVAIIVGYIVIYYTSWYFVDIILAVLVAIVILKWAIDILKNSTNTLLESSPLDINEVKNYIEKNDRVLELHDIHIWEITQDMYNMTAHIKIKKDDLQYYEDILAKVNYKLKEKFKIVHTTFQFEW